MKPREAGGVVDSKLNVYGAEGLKVAGAHLFSCVSFPLTPALPIIPRPLYTTFERSCSAFASVITVELLTHL